MPRTFKRKVDWSNPTERDFGTRRKKTRERSEVRFFNNLMEYARHFAEGRLDEDYLTEKFADYLIKLVDGNLPGTTKFVGTTSEPLTGRYTFKLKVGRLPIDVEITQKTVTVIIDGKREHVNSVDELIITVADAPYARSRISSRDLVYGIYVETRQLSERMPAVVYIEEAANLEDLREILKIDGLAFQGQNTTRKVLHEGYTVELGDFPRIYLRGKRVSKTHTHTATALFYKWTRSENPVRFTEPELRILKEITTRLLSTSVPDKH